LKNKNKTLTIFTLVEHKKKEDQLYGYGPYISEMNMWVSHFDKVTIVGHLSESKDIDKIELPYTHPNVKLINIPAFNIKSIASILKLLFSLPIIFMRMARAMSHSDHLHFRCPCNVSAVAAVVQIFFSSKLKTTKYAGHWDPSSNQPMGYRFQKWLLSNTFLTKNMKVLVYGEWEGQSKSVVPFISATYKEIEKTPFKQRQFSGKLKFVFIGAMVIGKRPVLTVKIIENLIKKGISAELHMFGNGPLINEVKDYIGDTRLGESFFVYGNQPKEKVKSCLQDAHFSILPSKSEGWPKAIAEGMFFGAIPISTKISCLPWMLDYGKRGILIKKDLNDAVDVIVNQLEQGDEFLNEMAREAMTWSQMYTLDKLNEEIGNLVIK